MMRLMALESEMSLSLEQSAVLSRVASQVARVFHRSHPWLDEADLASEAWVSMLEALPRFNPEQGDLGGYLYRVAMRAGKVLCWRLSVPANVPERSATSGKIARLRASTVGETEAAAVPADVERVDDALDTMQRGEALAQIVAEHLAASRHAEAVRAVLFGEAKSAEAAQKAGVPVAAVYEATKLTKRRIAADPRIKELV